jgi:diadenosine tetraphosphatase ApaH/serine/threonine PP2A family protein phosphatase
VAVLELIEQYAAKGAVVVLGNHDAAAMGRADEELNRNAMAAVEWTHAQLGQRQRAFLQSLPLTAVNDNLLFVHASAAAPEQWIYVTSPREAEESLEAGDANYIFSGHVHTQKLYYTGASGKLLQFAPVPGTPIPAARSRRWLAIVGSAGQPRDGNTAACYLLFDSERERLTFYRVPYDVGATIRKIRAAGLPERVALRLQRGT